MYVVREYMEWNVASTPLGYLTSWHRATSVTA